VDLGLEQTEVEPLVDGSAGVRGDQDERPAATFLEVVDHPGRQGSTEPGSAALGVDKDRADPPDTAVGGRDAGPDDGSVVVGDERSAR
jgi:hypothetical protein